MSGAVQEGTQVKVMRVAIYTGSQMLSERSYESSRFTWGEGHEEYTINEEIRADYACIYVDEEINRPFNCNIFKIPIYNPVINSRSLDVTSYSGYDIKIPDYSLLKYDEALTLKFISESLYWLTSDRLVVAAPNDGSYTLHNVTVGIKKSIEKY